MPVAFQDYYEALEVSRDASEDEIRQAYRRLARRYHPDVNKEPGAEDRFKQISEAYEVLRDPEKRERYDRLGANWRAGQDVSGAAGFGEGFDAGNGFGDVRVEFGGGDFSDFFESLFGPSAQGQPDGRASRASRCAAATTRRCSIWGSRKPPGEASGGCRWATGARSRSTSRAACATGSGSGWPDRAAPGVGGGPAGDLFLRIRLRPHPRFRVEGRDLYVDLPVAPWEAALGAEVPVPTLDGNARVKVPPGSSSGRRLRLRGQGMPGSQEAPPGDLYAVVDDQRAEEADPEGARAVRAARLGVEVRPAEGHADGDHRTASPPQPARGSPRAARRWSGSSRSPREAGIHPELVRRLIGSG